jgi:hypothetical protein
MLFSTKEEGRYEVEWTTYLKTFLAVYALPMALAFLTLIKHNYYDGEDALFS